jgi:hypothetical protein
LPSSAFRERQTFDAGRWDFMDFMDFMPLGL